MRGGTLLRFFAEDVSAIGQFNLVQTEDGVSLCGMETEPSTFNVLAVQTLLHVLQLVLRCGQPGVVRTVTASVFTAATKESQFNAEGFRFPQQAGVSVIVFGRRLLAGPWD